MLFRWLTSRAEPPFNDAWEATLESGVWQYRYLSEAQRERVRVVVAHLVARKHWASGGGFRLTDTVRVTISGVAALMTLGLNEPFFFPQLKTFIVYQAGYQAGPSSGDVGFLPPSDPVLGGETRLGEAWQRGPVVLAWRVAERQARAPGRGGNLVLHELAHHVDSHDGEMDGRPHFETAEQRRRWAEVLEFEHNRLVGQTRRREPTLLDPYGATSQAEFFAVATESFFEQPHAMRQQHSELFELMTNFFRQDPSAWLPARPRTAVRGPAARGGKKRRPRGRGFSTTGLNPVDALFTHGVVRLADGDPAGAEQLFTEVLRRSPEDEEARQQRARARLELRDFRGAQADAKAALDADPEDLDAALTLATACLELGEDQRVAGLLRRVLREWPDNTEARRLEGRLRGRANRWREAAKAFRRVLAHDPYDAVSHFWLAECYERLNDPAAAVASRERAGDLAPDIRSRRPPM